MIAVVELEIERALAEVGARFVFLLDQRQTRSCNEARRDKIGRPSTNLPSSRAISSADL